MKNSDLQFPQRAARGYPILEQIGVQLKLDTLYGGGADLLVEVANAMRGGAHPVS